MGDAEVAGRLGRFGRIQRHPAIKLALPILIIAIATFVLHKLASHVRWSEVKADLSATSWWNLLIAFGGTLISYVAFALYDMLGVQSVARGKVPLPLAGVAGVSGFAVSNLLGFSYLTGTAIRFRIYAGLGLGIETVGAIVAASLIGFWLGMGLLIGALMTTRPVGLGAILPLGGVLETGIGLVVLVGLAMVFRWLARGKRTLSLAGTTVEMPSLPIALGLTGAALLDILGAALCMYVLLPADIVASFPYFFIIFVAAITFGIVSSSPGGLGVFEATLIAGLGASGRSDMLAALLLFRVIYTLVPFLLATVGLGLAWALDQRQAVASGASLTHRLLRPIVPPVAAVIALLAGVILLTSGSLPVDGTRLGVLRDVLPLFFVEASHLIGSLVGLLLIVVARGLYLRRHRAWLAAVGLMAVGLVVSLAKGLDWEEAGAIAFTLGCLLLFRSAFYRLDDAPLFRLTGRWLAGVVGLLAISLWIGLFAYSNVAYRDALWWQFSWNGDASRFLRAALAVGIGFALVLINSFLLGKAAKETPQPIPDTVRNLVAQSPDAEARLALTGDKAFLIAEDGAAYLAYADTGASLIAKGDPVGDAAAGRDLIWRLREKADRAGKRCAFYSVSQAFLPTYLDLGLSILKIGEVARVDLTAFSFDGSKRKDFRQARARAARDGYEFAVIPAAEIATVLPELRTISDAWLAAKNGEEKGFSLGAFDAAYLANFDLAVLRHKATGKIVAFANLFQGAGRREISVDLMRYAPDGPNVAMDALFGELLAWAQAQGFAWFSLGAAPLSGMERRRLASVWNRVGGFVYEHGERFYNFEGLRAFKEKFDPVWTPNYLASPGGLAVPRILYEINVLVSGGVRGLVT